METINVREDYVVNWNGPGWYADLGRWDTDGKSYVEGEKLPASMNTMKTPITRPKAATFGIYELAEGRPTN